jgi:hypothetical protein
MDHAREISANSRDQLKCRVECPRHPRRIAWGDLGCRHPQRLAGGDPGKSLLRVESTRQLLKDWWRNPC